MTSQSSTLAQTKVTESLNPDVVALQPQTKTLGAFDAPVARPAAAGQSPAKPQTEQLSLDIGTGQTKSSNKPIEIPKDVKFSSPVAVVKASTSSSNPERAVVTYVADGDTASLKRSDGSAVQCRIDGINAPETAKPKANKPGQTFGEEAKNALQTMIDKKEVTVQVSYAKDQYGRNICQIDVAGKNVSREMVRQGAAWMYKKYSKDPEMSGIESNAKASKEGLWAFPNPINPAMFGKSMEQYGKPN